ncbi:ABC transporter permease [Sorangium sp. So ce131]|uniref:ABC transporter permease n=1 Tax=Sorangium sp. So ce131 TaxID=3133282 RepID=UPI003F60C235
MWTGYLVIAAKALSAHRLRSMLTVLSITIGAFAIVLMSSLAESGITTLSRGIEETGGARLILLAPKVPERAEGKQGMYPPGFERRDKERLFAGVPHVTEVVMFASLGMQDILSEQGKQARTDLVAADSGFFDTFRMRVGRGRAFSEEEDQGRARVCVVGHQLAEKLWRGDPLGRSVTIGALRCRVVGVLADNDRFGVDFGFDWVDVLIAPLETVIDVEGRGRVEATIVAKTADVSANDPVKRILNARLLERHRGVDDFTIYDFSAVMAQLKKMFAIAEVIVALIAGVALLIGGFGVMNMMLVSISERVREIGIRKALGAAPGDISAQFLCEAVLLSGSGGLFGALGGALAAALVAPLLRGFLPAWVGSISTAAVAAAMAVSLGVGVGFGWLPARRAGRLDPVVAMRR